MYTKYMSTQDILKALVAEGFADSTEECEAMLEDMGFDPTDLEEIWEVGA